MLVSYYLPDFSHPLAGGHLHGLGGRQSSEILKCSLACLPVLEAGAGRPLRDILWPQAVPTLSFQEAALAYLWFFPPYSCGQVGHQLA